MGMRKRSEEEGTESAKPQKEKLHEAKSDAEGGWGDREGDVGKVEACHAPSSVVL